MERGGRRVLPHAWVGAGAARYGSGGGRGYGDFFNFYFCVGAHRPEGRQGEAVEPFTAELWNAVAGECFRTLGRGGAACPDRLPLIDDGTTIKACSSTLHQAT